MSESLVWENQTLNRHRPTCMNKVIHNSYNTWNFQEKRQVNFQVYNTVIPYYNAFVIVQSADLTVVSKMLRLQV
jgi:hypothetical protein